MAQYEQYALGSVFRITKIATLLYYELSKDFQATEESHDFWEMVYVDKGEAISTINHQTHLLKQGEAIFIAPNDLHALAANGVTAPMIFIVSFVCRSKQMEYFKNKTFTVPKKHLHCIASILEEGQKVFYNVVNSTQNRPFTLNSVHPAECRQLIRIYLEELLIQLWRGENSSAFRNGSPCIEELSGNQLVDALLTYLEQNVYGKVTVESLCKKFNYSRTYLSTLFKQEKNRSIYQYYMGLKMNEAKKLLREERYNIAQISDLLGFNAPNYFTQSFKKYCGMTPMEYQKSIR